ncbi:MAG: hypothetical protein ACRDH9_11625 [Actinomycetota bacterium]
MQTFIVHGKNRSGELAKLTGALAAKNVNVLITALGVNGQGVASFVASDEAAAQTALKEAGFEFKTFPSFTIRLNDMPGMAADVCRKLGDQGVNIECWLPVNVTEDKVIIALGVDNLEAAKKALDEFIVEYSYS